MNIINGLTYVFEEPKSIKILSVVTMKEYEYCSDYSSISNLQIFML